MLFRRPGGGRRFEALLDALSDLPCIGEIHTAVPAAQKDRFLERFRHPAIRPVFVGYGPMGAGDYALKSIVLRSLRDSVRLFLFPGPDVPLSVPGRYVVFVDDLAAPPGDSPLSRQRGAGRRWLLGRAVRGAEEVVAASATLRRRLVREFDLAAEDVRVIYPWVREEMFLPPPGGGSPVPGEYILCPALPGASGNAEGVFRAFGILAEEFPSLKLVIAGERGSDRGLFDRRKTNPRIEGRIVELPDPSDDDLRRMFGGAKAFVFPPFEEGSGLPALEAMAAGVPVVCSDIPVFREVLGTAARFVDPGSPESIARGVRELLADPAPPESPGRKGRERASQFRRERFVRSCLDLLG
jgi:glycosyltransferase involved in cell wall biosynthesis